MTRGRAAAVSAAASFCVYAIPLVTPHTAWLLGEVLFQGEARSSPRWMALNVGVALAMQVGAAILFYWFFRRPVRTRAVALVLTAFAAVSMAQRMYLAKIPAMFLEEPDTAPERASWPAVCTAQGVWQTNLRTPDEVWVRYTNQTNRYAVLTMPGCRLADLNLPQPTLSPGGRVDFMIDVTSVISGERGIVRKYETKSAETSWWLATAASLTRLEPPAGHTDRGGSPILSADGRYVGWLEEIAGSGPPVLYDVVLRPLDEHEPEMVIDLSNVGPGTYFLEEVNMEARELRLWKTDQLIAAGFDGALKHRFAQPRQCQPQYNTYIAAGDHWLGWDAYRDSAAYLMEWSLPAGSGTHRVPLGRSIHGAAVDASGEWIGVSVGTSLNIGSAKDAVYVLRAADGHEVFRKYLPPFSRSPVAFLNGGYFVYSDSTGVRVTQTSR